MNKPLKDWTLGELKDYCAGMECEDCIFKDGHVRCTMAECPCYWEVENNYNDNVLPVQLPPNTTGEVVCKSGLNVNHGLICSGLIDEGYSGSIVVKLYNPKRWDLSEPPRWTEQDKEDARKIKAMLPAGVALEMVRLETGTLRLVIVDELSFVSLNKNLLPSLKPGERATLDEIIGGTNE